MKALTETCKEFGADFRQTVEKVKIRFGISKEEAQEAVRKSGSKEGYMKILVTPPFTEEQKRKICSAAVNAGEVSGSV